MRYRCATGALGERLLQHVPRQHGALDPDRVLHDAFQRDAHRAYNDWAHDYAAYAPETGSDVRLP